MRAVVGGEETCSATSLSTKGSPPGELIVSDVIGKGSLGEPGEVTAAAVAPLFLAGLPFPFLGERPAIPLLARAAAAIAVKLL